MANISQFEADGAVYTYDKESRSPLALKNVKKAFEGTLVYGVDKSGMTAPADDETLDVSKATTEEAVDAAVKADKITTPSEAGTAKNKKAAIKEAAATAATE